MTKFIHRVVVTTLVFVILFSQTVFHTIANAVDVYWDNNGATAGFGAAGGTWDAPTLNQWSTDSTGASAPGASVTTTSADDLYFGFGTNGLASGTITLPGTVDAQHLFFGKSSGDVLLSGGTINLGAGTSEIAAETSGGSTTAEVTIDSNIAKTAGQIRIGRQNTTGENYIINGVISGSTSLDLRPVNNGAFVALNGANTFTGNVSNVTGQLNINSVADSGVASSLGTGSVFSMSGGGGQNPLLWYTGVTDGSTNRTVNLNGGINRIVSQDAQLQLSGDVTGTSGSFESQLFLSGDAGGGSNSNEISGVVGGNVRVVVGTVAPIGGTGEVGVWSLSGVNTYDGTTTINSGSTLQLGNGGTSGSLNTASVISIGSGATLAFNQTDTVTQGVDFGDSISGDGGVTQNGSGVVDLKFGSTYTGDTTVNAGTLRYTNVSDLASVATQNFLINNGSTLEFQSSVGGANRTVLNNKVFTFDSNGGGTINFDGGNHLFQGGGSTHNIVTNGGSKNTISSTSGGFMNMQGGGNIVFDVADGSDPVDLELAATFLNGQITKNGDGTLSITTSTIASAGNNAITINAGTVDVGSAATLGGGTFSDSITNNGTFSYSSSSNQDLTGVITGTGNVVQNSSGTLTLSGNNTYTGTTTVDAGTLINVGDQSAATGDVTIATGATLAGTGTVGGDTTVAGTHSTGVNGVGLQTLANNLNYTTGANVQWELEADSVSNRGTSFDGINVSGDLTFDAPTTIDLDFVTGVDFGNAFWTTDQQWNLWDVTGTTTGFSNLSIASISIDSLGAGATGTFSLVQAGQDVNLLYTAVAVPEPSALAMLAIGFAGFGLRRRRRESR